MRYGFVGLGHLGRHLAASLARAGFALTVHDRRRDSAAPLLALGTAWAYTPREDFQPSNVVWNVFPPLGAPTTILCTSALDAFPSVVVVTDTPANWNTSLTTTP